MLLAFCWSASLSLRLIKLMVTGWWQKSAEHLGGAPQRRVAPCKPVSSDLKLFSFFCGNFAVEM